MSVVFWDLSLFLTMTTCILNKHFLGVGVSVLRAYRWRLPVIYTRTVHHLARRSFPVTHDPTISLQLPSPLMSHTHPTSTSSSNFQLIFDNALRAYERRTKKDIRNHPLVTQLQDCNSPGNILDVLQQQVEELNQSQRRNEKWTRWLDPTIKVLHAFSDTLGEHVTSVCLGSSARMRPALSYLFDRHFHRQKLSLPQSASSFRCVSFYMLVRPIVMRSPLRQPRMCVQVTTLFSKSSSVLNRFSND
jgi:hypothetical protein